MGTGTCCVCHGIGSKLELSQEESRQGGLASCLACRTAEWLTGSGRIVRTHLGELFLTTCLNPQRSRPLTARAHSISSAEVRNRAWPSPSSQSGFYWITKMENIATQSSHCDRPLCACLVPIKQINGTTVPKTYCSHLCLGRDLYVQDKNPN